MPAFRFVASTAPPETGRPVERFQSDESIPVFLISLKAGGGT